jgi:hypothetical protein
MFSPNAPMTSVLAGTRPSGWPRGGRRASTALAASEVAAAALISRAPAFLIWPAAACVLWPGNVSGWI